MTIKHIRAELQKIADPKRAERQLNFFKHCRDDVFLGIPTPVLRRLARQFGDIELEKITTLVRSSVHEERTLGHAILRYKFERIETQEKVVQFYLKHRGYIRDWDGVDDSAPYILGPYLLNKKKDLLLDLARSEELWDRRISIVTTWWFIRNDHLNTTIKIAKILLDDTEDLIHKATGWMLRELGKKDIELLRSFLSKYKNKMHRTTLRYAIERFSPKERALWMGKSNI